MGPEKGSVSLVQFAMHDVRTFCKNIGLFKFRREQDDHYSFQTRLNMSSHRNEMKLFTYLMESSQFSEATVLLQGHPVD